MSTYNKVIDYETINENLEYAKLDLESLLKTIKKYEIK